VRLSTTHLSKRIRHKINIIFCKLKVLWKSLLSMTNLFEQLYFIHKLYCFCWLDIKKEVWWQISNYITSMCVSYISIAWDTASSDILCWCSWRVLPVLPRLSPPTWMSLTDALRRCWWWGSVSQVLPRLSPPTWMSLTDTLRRCWWWGSVSQVLPRLSPPTWMNLNGISTRAAVLVVGQ
jgi:hypothetical protein